MTRTLAALATILLISSAAAAPAPHRCADDAKVRAAALLQLHFDSDGTTLAPDPGEPKAGQEQMQNWSLDDEAKVIAPIKALKGKGKFDVLEINGYIYKGEYRMRFIYAQIPDTCALMGQEILENVDPVLVRSHLPHS